MRPLPPHSHLAVPGRTPAHPLQALAGTLLLVGLLLAAWRELVLYPGGGPRPAAATAWLRLTRHCRPHHLRPRHPGILLLLRRGCSLEEAAGRPAVWATPLLGARRRPPPGCNRPVVGGRHPASRLLHWTRRRWSRNLLCWVRIHWGPSLARGRPRLTECQRPQRQRRRRWRRRRRRRRYRRRWQRPQYPRAGRPAVVPPATAATWRWSPLPWIRCEPACQALPLRRARKSVPPGIPPAPLTPPSRHAGQMLAAMPPAPPWKDGDAPGPSIRKCPRPLRLRGLCLSCEPRPTPRSRHPLRMAGKTPAARRQWPRA